MRSDVLGFPVDVLSRDNSIKIITQWIKNRSGKPKMVVTAYSEFYVEAFKNPEFGNILKTADLVTPDGVSVLAAVEYERRSKGVNILAKIFQGLSVGRMILGNELGETVTGVWLFEELVRLSARNGWKIFLLGGWDKVSERTAKALRRRFPDIRVEYDEGERSVGTDPATDRSVVEKINRFKPDLLFVAYNPVKQEKWIAAHMSKLKVGVAMGVGGTFNEFLGDFKKAPIWMEAAGLKWLWRVIVEPRRLPRILKAVVIFPWLVFKDILYIR